MSNTSPKISGSPRGSALKLVPLAMTMILLAGCANDSDSSRRQEQAQLDPPSAFDAGAGQPPNAKTLHALSRILATQGRDREAMYTLRRIIYQFPDYLPAYNDLAEAHLRFNQTDDANKSLSSGLARSPNDPVLNNNMGMCWMMKEDYARALEYFDKAVAAASKNQVYQANQAAALAMLGRDGEARAAYVKVLTPNDADANLTVLKKARQMAATAPPAEPADNSADSAPLVEPSSPAPEAEDEEGKN